MPRIPGSSTYANVASTLALVLVLGGVAYGAATLPRNSVGTRQLKKNAVTSPKVKNGALLRKDLKKGQVDAPNVKRFGPVNMNVGDAPRTLVSIPGMRLRGECSRVLNTADPADDEISLHIELIATVPNLNYQSYLEGGGVNDSDEDLDPGEGANWADLAGAAFVSGSTRPPETATASVLLPNGTGVLGRTVMIANRGSFDCTYLGRLDLT
jgi:hypothetical protein